MHSVRFIVRSRNPSADNSGHGGVTVSTGIVKCDKRAEFAVTLQNMARLKLNAKNNISVSFNKSVQVAA